MAKTLTLTKKQEHYMRNVIYYIAKQYKKMNKQKYKTYNERKYRLYQFLNNIFKEDREEFLNTIQDKLQRGRIKYQLENYYDDTRETYQQSIEKAFLYGWYYNEIEGNPVLYKEKVHTTGCINKASLQYAKYLTNKYGKSLFDRAI